MPPKKDGRKRKSFAPGTKTDNARVQKSLTRVKNRARDQSRRDSQKNDSQLQDQDAPSGSNPRTLSQNIANTRPSSLDQIPSSIQPTQLNSLPISQDHLLSQPQIRSQNNSTVPLEHSPILEIINSDSLSSQRARDSSISSSDSTSSEDIPRHPSKRVHHEPENQPLSQNLLRRTQSLSVGPSLSQNLRRTQSAEFNLDSNVAVENFYHRHWREWRLGSSGRIFSGEGEVPTLLASRGGPVLDNTVAE